MSSWKESRLGEVAEIIMGQSPTGDTCNTNGKGTPLLNGPTEFGIRFPKAVQFTISPKKISEINDILFCVRGSTTGRMNWANEHYALGRGLASIRHRQGHDYRYFIKALLNFNLPVILASATGSTFPNVSREQLENLDIFLPPLEEQKAIAEVLSSLDDKIDLLHRQNQTLESLAQTLFRQWFIEEAKEEWAENTVGDIAILKSGKSRPKEESEINNIPIYGGNGILGFTNQHNIDGETIIIGRVGAYCGSLYMENKPIWVSDNALIAKPKNALYSKYLFYILKENELNSMAEGSSHPLLTQEPIKSIQILLPPESKLQEFNNQVNLWYKKMNKNKKQIQILEDLRDTLLPKLLSGEVRVEI